MSYAKQMLDTHPGTPGLDPGLLAEVIDALDDCAQACTACSDACLSEGGTADLAKCIRLNLDCAEQCATTSRVLSRQTGYDANATRAVVEACAQLCRSCGDECDRHAGHHEHCRVCAEACRRCEEACRRVLEAISG